ncbi:hypothetical protein [Yersinia sp. 1652 StPb PI]|uniref:hypothetical protein n=1 Tax=Yersinia sp. 1652 StPb PI TaxID=3061649 RepID=UPI00355C35D0
MKKKIIDHSRLSVGAIGALGLVDNAFVPVVVCKKTVLVNGRGFPVIWLLYPSKTADVDVISTVSPGAGDNIKPTVKLTEKKAIENLSMLKNKLSYAHIHGQKSQ